VPGVTLWILVNGYMILTGATREPLAAFLLKAAKVYFWMLLATGAAAFNGDLRQNVTDFRDAAATLVTGSNTNVWTQMQDSVNQMAAATAIAGVVTGAVGEKGDDGSGRTVAALGQTIAVAAPVMTIGLTAFTLEAAVLIGAALAPLFFFMGIFQRFADWPIAWIKYMMATLISAAVMAALSAWGLGLMVAFMGAAALGYVAGMGMVQISAIMGAGGLLISALMITIPGLVMKVFNMAGNGAARNEIGGGGGGGGGSPARPKPSNSNSASEGSSGSRVLSGNPRSNSDIA
jgi:type IV secretion system protein VirB6